MLKRKLEKRTFLRKGIKVSPTPTRSNIFHMAIAKGTTRSSILLPSRRRRRTMLR
jgi:hypothetical protein